MIIKVELIEDNGTTNCMMFGNDYKKWSQQFYEYLLSKNREGIHYRRYGLLEQSKVKWIGGLKWIDCDSFPGDYMERTGKDAERIKFESPSCKTLNNVISILAEVYQLRLDK